MTLRPPLARLMPHARERSTLWRLPRRSRGCSSPPARGQACRLAILAALTLATGTAMAQPTGRPGATVDFGKREFESNCASCHGMDGKGRGPVAGFLTRNPPDLTTLARQHQGILPMNRLYESIEGGGTPLHGGREMPIWGRTYRIQDAEYQGEGPYDAEALVRARILSLLEYIHRLQVR